MKSTHRRSVLRNTSACDPKAPAPTIKLSQGDVGWDEAYANWLLGKNPTDSPEWKKGIHLYFELEEEGELPTPKSKFKHILALVLVFIIIVATVYFTTVYKGLKNDSADQHSSAVPVRLPEGYASSPRSITVCRQLGCQSVS